jgi:hypothetical protein
MPHLHVAAYLIQGMPRLSLNHCSDEATALFFIAYKFVLDGRIAQRRRRIGHDCSSVALPAYLRNGTGDGDFACSACATGVAIFGA